MKRSILALTLLTLLPVWIDVFAIEKLYTDDKGFRHYTCGVEMRGAKILIKDIGRDRFRVKSSRFSGIMNLPKDKAESRWCTGMLGAVRVLCGFCKDPTSSGNVEDKIKQLGLHSAD